MAVLIACRGASRHTPAARRRGAAARSQRRDDYVRFSSSRAHDAARRRFAVEVSGLKDY